MAKQKNKKLRVGIIYGGKSSEHEISVNTAGQVHKYLDKNKYAVQMIKISKTGAWSAVSLRSLPKKIDVAFIALHGSFGEDGAIQGFLETLGIPYTFSGILASALAMDKFRTQQVAQSVGIHVPRSVFVNSATWKQDASVLLRLIKRLGNSIISKPNNQGSSVGVKLWSAKTVTRDHINRIVRDNGDTLFQQFIKGREITVPVLGNSHPKVLPIIEIVPTVAGGKFYDYTAKYAAGGSRHVIPAPLPPGFYKKVEAAGKTMHTLLGCRGASRSDFIVAGNKFYFLETNTIPGMTSTSLLPDSARHAGIPFPQLLDDIIGMAFA